MADILSFLASVPDVYWSGLGGALFTLGGVILSEHYHAKRLRIQLEHDADEKRKERTAALRQDVYLRSIEELTKANAHLAVLPSIDPTKVNISDGLQGFFSTAARLQLVAEPKTAVLVNRLVGDYGALLMDLLAQLRPVHNARSDIDRADRFYTRAQAEITRILGEMARVTESGKHEPAAFAALDSGFKHFSGQSEKFAEERDNAWSRFNVSNIAFQRALFARFRDLGPRQIPVMIELRRDLGLSTDLHEMEAQLQQQTVNMQQRLDAFLAEHDAK